ncbi:uncharacterized protein G2W53_037432 [Senna tora]|uniref:Uncharacterized protein n=1 Tax=Senna tora TaxID=362788 RepID=A0A834T6E7_9FABA|nr:uncharacterized protein G2W53_037432 [Senna tora]
MPPFTDFEITLLNHVVCAPSMMMPNSWILVGGFEALCNFHKVEATGEAFFYFFQMNFPQKGSWFYFQARGRGPHAKKLFQDLRDPPKDWKKDFFLVRPWKGCQPAWWLREDGTPLFPTKWVEPFEAIPRTVLRTSSTDTQKTVRVLSGKFNPARVLSLVKREEAKLGKNRSADRSGSSSAHQPRPRGGSKDEEPKKGHGKGHSSHSGGKGKASASSGSKTSGLTGHKRRNEKDAELRSPSLKRAKAPVHAPESGAKDGFGLPAPSVPAAAATEKRPHGSVAETRREPKSSLPINKEVVKRCEESIQKEKAFLAAKKELEQLRPEMASLCSSEQLLKVQLENAQKELKRKLIADHNSLMGEYESLLQKFREANSENIQLEDALEEERETVKALTNDCSGAMEWGWNNCLEQVRFFNPQADLELRHMNLHHEVEGQNIIDISTRAVLWRGPFDASHELSPDDMMDGTTSELLILEPYPLSPSAPVSEKADAEEASPGTGIQVAEEAKGREEPSAPKVVGPQELPEVPQVEPAAGEPGATELKPAASSEEFANSILVD